MINYCGDKFWYPAPSIEANMSPKIITLALIFSVWILQQKKQMWWIDCEEFGILLRQLGQHVTRAMTPPGVVMEIFISIFSSKSYRCLLFNWRRCRWWFCISPVRWPPGSSRHIDALLEVARSSHGIFSKMISDEADKTLQFNFFIFNLDKDIHIRQLTKMVQPVLYHKTTLVHLGDQTASAD